MVHIQATGFYMVRSAITRVKYGLLYNWYAATDIRNICAEGWSVPDEAKALILTAYIGGTYAGGELKEIGLVHWITPNVAATNSTKFNARGSGVRYASVSFNNLGESWVVWLTDVFIGFPGIAESLQVNNFSDQVHPSGSGGIYFYKEDGLAIRPVKDSTTLTHGQTGTYTGNDGKIYRTICIGTQEWLADNLAETKYRIANSDLLENWVNVDFASLSADKLDIINAVAGDDFYKIRTNWFHLQTGDNLYYSLNFNLISGVYPYLIFFKNNTNMPFYAGGVATEGINDGSCLIDEEADYAIGFVSWGAATEFSIESLTAYTENHPLSDDIPEVTNDAAWAALTTGALCAYDNDWDNVLM